MRHLTAFAIVMSLSLTLTPAAFAQTPTGGLPAQHSEEVAKNNAQQDKAALAGSDQLGDFFDDTVFTPVNPCRIVDTRVAVGAFVGTRTYDVDGASFAAQGGNPGPCGIPFGVATSVVMTVTVTGPSNAGFMTAWGLGAQPLSSVLNWSANQTIANTTVVPVVPGAGNDFSIFVSGVTNVIIDVQGFFSANIATALDHQILVNSIAVAAGDSAYDAYSPICPAGYRLTGGGGLDNIYLNNGPIGSRPIANNSNAIVSGFNAANQWLVQGNTVGKSATTIFSFAICSRVPGR